MVPELSGGNPGGSIHQNGVVFCYDDLWTDASGAPSYVRCLRTKNWKYAIYYANDAYSSKPTTVVQYELYNLSDSTFSSSNPNALLADSMLEENNLVNIDASTLTTAEKQAVETQWETMHYTLLGLMANADVVSGLPAGSTVTIPADEMLNALPYGIDPSNPLAQFTDWCTNVTPTFQI